MNVYETVKEFCVRKLAQILYDCLECSASDRALHDWLTAERFVNSNSGTVSLIVEILKSQLPIAQDYTFETFDKICGRAVWDGMYQPLKRQLWLTYYPESHYTYVRFG